MAEASKSGTDVLSPEIAVAAAQHGLTSLCRAWTQVAMGMLAAGQAEMELSRAFFASTPTDWQKAFQPSSARDASRQWLESATSRCENAIKAQRNASDAFASVLTKATELMIDGLPDSKLNVVSVPVKEQRAS